jgi:hypothetical protein
MMSKQKTFEAVLFTKFTTNTLNISETMIKIKDLDGVAEATRVHRDTEPLSPVVIVKIESHHVDKALEQLKPFFCSIMESPKRRIPLKP